MSREIIQEALNGIRDEYITEAGARLGLLAVGAAGAVGAASGAAVDPSALYSLSGTEAAAKAGFGAWLAKGGWIALVAGVVVAAGVAAGAFFFGKGGDMPPVGTGDVTTEEQEQSRFEEDVTTEEQEESRFEEDDSEESTMAESESESESRAETESETETETVTTLHEHTFSEWQTDGTPPCASKRYQYRVCSCGFQEKESIPSEEHVYGEWDVYEPATCYHTGTLYTSCNVCGSKKRQYDAIEKTPHSFEGGYCSVCGLIEGADECFTFRFFNGSNAETVAYISSRDGVTGERVILPNVAYDDFTKQIVPVVGLDEGLFSYDETLREIILPDSFDGISKKAFAYCVNLQSIDLPSHIDTIGNMAFYGCTSLTEITLPDSVAAIYDEAFAGCTGIIKVNLSDSLLHIGEEVFADCTGITEVNLPDSLLYIGMKVFADCTSLTRVTLPVVHFGTSLFRGCSSLTRVDYKGSVSQWTEEMSWHESPLSPTSFTVYCNDGEIVVNGG